MRGSKNLIHRLQMLSIIIKSNPCGLLRIFYAFTLKIYELLFIYSTGLKKVILIFTA